jgi:hypothetical protein
MYSLSKYRYIYIYGFSDWGEDPTFVIVLGSISPPSGTGWVLYCLGKYQPRDRLNVKPSPSRPRTWQYVAWSRHSNTTGSGDRWVWSNSWMMIIWGKVKKLGENPTPVLLCPLGISNEVTRDWTRDSAVRCQYLNAWATARPRCLLVFWWNFTKCAHILTIQATKHCRY